MTKMKQNTILVFTFLLINFNGIAMKRQISIKIKEYNQHPPVKIISIKIDNIEYRVRTNGEKKKFYTKFPGQYFETGVSFLIADFLTEIAKTPQKELKNLAPSFNSFEPSQAPGPNTTD